MKIKLRRLQIFLIIALVSCGGRGSTSSEDAVKEQSETRQEYAVNSAPDPKKEALISAYPDFIRAIDNDTIYFIDGTTIVYDDHIDKDFDTMLDHSDPEDMFFVTYRSDSIPHYLADAGRSRSEVLFKKMYGQSEREVASRLVNVPWCNSVVRFTSVNGGADSLRKVSTELSKIPGLAKYLPCSGTFYWRTVRGASRQSAHSYGIAIDIAVPHSDYWLWKNPGAKETDYIEYANRIPHEIVDIFERYGFVWGGAWYHFDTMHFEFRPEILRYSRLTNK